MDVTLPKKDLLRLVARASSVADKKSTMPVLANVLLQASDDGSLSISATDLSLSVQGTAAAEVHTQGSVALSARALLDRVKAMPDMPLQLTSESTGSTMLAAPGSARRYTLHGVPGSEFPKLPAPDADATAVEIPAALLELLINRTQFSVSPDDSRPSLNSALFEWQGSKASMVTTDGHRLSRMEVDVAGSDASASMLLPLKAIVELRRLADDAKGEEGAKIELFQQGPNVFFRREKTLFGIKLIEAQFPSYQQVIPDTTERKATLARAPFSEALRAVSLAASDRTGGVTLTANDGLLRITSESPESGDGLDELPMDYEGGEITIGFNAKYFLDILAAMDGEDEIVIQFSGELDPAIVRPATEADDRSYLAVVMPMHL